MRVVALHFRGYACGASDFAPVFDNAALTDQQALLDIIGRMADSIVSPGQERFTALTIVGHADRCDDGSCDERRAGERAASEERAIQAWAWVRERVDERLAAAGIDGGQWWDSDGDLTWSLVFASTGMLEFDPPTEAQRALNRRVVMLASLFDNQ